jgi:amino acid permease
MLHFFPARVVVVCSDYATVSFIFPRCKMATFILLLQEIVSNVDSFIVVFALIVTLISTMYHVLLFQHEEHEEWGTFAESFWLG